MTISSSPAPEPVPPPPPPAARAALLPPDVDLARGWRHPEAATVWWGVVWGRLGRGDLAWAHLDLVEATDLQPWVAAERGRLLREWGAHAEAEAVESPALAQAEDPVDLAMLRISSTANAVGFGEVELATSRLHAAREAAAEADSAASGEVASATAASREVASDSRSSAPVTGDLKRGTPLGPRAARQRLRLSWVEVEVAWLRGETPPTAALPTWSEGFGGPQLPADHAAGSSFHTAKGLLFAGVVRDDDRLLAAALEEAPPVLAWAIHAARADRGVAGEAKRARRERTRLVPPPPLRGP